MIVVIDTETTGLEPPEAEVIEIAAVAIGGGMGSVLVKPHGGIPPETSAVHHLVDEDFVNGASFGSVKEAWIALAGRLIMGPVEAYVAHNAEFDKKFLPFLEDAPWLCTWRCAMHCWPDAPGHGNQVLRYYLGIKPDLPGGLAPHRALYDAIVTTAILQEMLKLKTLPELLELQGLPVLQKKVRFGKHRDMLWKDVDKSYLQWVLRSDFDSDVQYTAHHWLMK